MTGSTRAVFAAAGALSLAGSVIALFVGLALLEPYDPYLLLIPLLIPLGAIAAPKVWKRPALGVAGAVALIAVPWGTGEEGQELAHVTASDLASAALVGIVAVRFLVVRDEAERLRSWVILPLAGIILAGSAATILAYDPLFSFSGLVRYAEIFVVVPAATYLAIRSRSDLKLILSTIIALAIFEGVVGVYQYLTEAGAGFGDAFGEFDTIRATGTFGAGSILGMAHIVAYALVISAAIFAGLRSRGRWWGLLLVVMLCFPLAFSLSRGAWISATVGTIVVLALGSRRSLIILVSATVLVLGIFSAIAASNSSGVVAERLESISSSISSPDESVQGRYALWRASSDMWIDRPVTGIGVKNFPYFRDTYLGLHSSNASHVSDNSGGTRDQELLSSHSLYFLILSEQGLLGILAYGSLFLSLGIIGLRHLRDTKEFSAERVFGIASLGCLASYLTSGIYLDPGSSVVILNSVLLGSLIWLATGAKLKERGSDEIAPQQTSSGL